MSRPQDFFGASPKTVLSRPFFHCQDQKAYNVDGGTSIADAWTKRTLNTVIKNDIQGASLANDQVSLPAGVYYVEGVGTFLQQNAASTALAIFKDGAKQVQGATNPTHATYSQPIIIDVSGVVVLSQPGVIDLRYYTGIGIATGLGTSNNSGSFADTSLPSIYADLKIWQLDRSLEIAPVAVNSGLQTVPGLNTEGHVMGFDSYSTGNVITVGKGSCLDSTLTVPIAFTADKTVTIPGTINQDFFIFAVRKTDGVTYEPRAYTTLAGPASDNQIDAWRLVSYCKTNGSGVVMPYMQVASVIEWSTTTSPIVAPTLTASYVSYPLDTVVPISIWRRMVISDAPVAAGFYASYDGNEATRSGYTIGNHVYVEIIPVSSIYLRTTVVEGAYAKVKSITLRR